jgi:hypothetical protein
MAMQPAQATPTDVLSKQSAPMPERPNPLLTVLRWELRRALANRTTWVLAAALFVICFLLLEFSLLVTGISASTTISAAQTPTGMAIQRTVDITLTRNSIWGLAILFPTTLLEFGLFLPFVTADGVSLDLKRRTHELLMTTALPSRAYIWGRYLAGLLIALGMAFVYLLALLVLAVALHLKQGDYYPALDLPGALAIWSVVVLPPTILVSSLCFALGVLLPQRSGLIKAGAVFAWFLLGVFMQAYLFEQVRDIAGFARGNPPAWWTAYETWQPTNTDAGHLFMEQFLRRLYSILDNASLSNQAVQQQAHALQQQMPDLASFTGAHLILVALGLAIVFGASLSFRRFRNVLA